VEVRKLEASQRVSSIFPAHFGSKFVVRERGFTPSDGDIDRSDLLPAFGLVDVSTRTRFL